MKELILASIRTFFYDIDISSVVEDLKNGAQKSPAQNFIQQMSWRNSSFTRTEISQLYDYLCEYIEPFCQCGSHTKADNSKYFHLLHMFTAQCLQCRDEKPIVEFDQLVRWRDLSLLLGEDLLTISFLAHPETNNPQKLSEYAWPNIIMHNHKALNDILADGLTDIHAHLKASADVFELTWLDLMNKVVNRTDDYRKLSEFAEARLYTNADGKTYAINTLIQMAAYLRLLIFDSLHGNDRTTLLRRSLNLFDDTCVRKENLVSLQGAINVHSRQSLKTSCGKVLDYCHTQYNGHSIYAVHAGERAWMYDFFYRFYRNDDGMKRIADYVYLYMLLKIRIRREFVQTNPLVGFDNFKIYENRKTVYCNAYKELYPLYAVQSSIRSNSSDKFEARVVPNTIPDCEFDKSLFDRGLRYANINTESLSFVIHFIKHNENSLPKNNSPLHGSRYGFKNAYKQEIFKVLDDRMKRRRSKMSKCRPYQITGIDAAGAELNCPPAVFGHVYRHARRCGLHNLTYHVGEDFYDLVDGLRSVEEAILFLQLERDSRLGHALALGADACKYYDKRGRQVIMTKQRLLDALVWLIYKCNEFRVVTPSRFLSQLEAEARMLYNDLGYSEQFDVNTIYFSQRLRSDELSADDSLSEWGRTALCLAEECRIARLDRRASELNKEFYFNINIIEKGDKKHFYTYPEGIADVVSGIQKQIQEVVKSKAIIIECNPSSNVKIGSFDSYYEHPIFKYNDNNLITTVNTDDKGIFATSLYNELSLIAYAYREHPDVTEEDMLDFVRELKHNAELYIFR